MIAIRRIAKHILVMDAIGEGRRFTAYKVGKAAGCSDTTARKHLRRLEEQGVLVSVWQDHRKNSKKQVFYMCENAEELIGEIHDVHIPKQLRLPL